jgi:hypothetical protein
MGALLGASMEYQDFIALKISLLWWQCGGYTAHHLPKAHENPL